MAYTYPYSEKLFILPETKEVLIDTFHNHQMLLSPYMVLLDLQKERTPFEGDISLLSTVDISKADDETLQRVLATADAYEKYERVIKNTVKHSCKNMLEQAEGLLRALDYRKAEIFSSVLKKTEDIYLAAPDTEYMALKFWSSALNGPEEPACNREHLASLFRDADECQKRREYGTRVTLDSLSGDMAGIITVSSNYANSFPEIELANNVLVCFSPVMLQINMMHNQNIGPVRRMITSLSETYADRLALETNLSLLA